MAAMNGGPPGNRYGSQKSAVSRTVQYGWGDRKEQTRLRPRLRPLFFGEGPPYWTSPGALPRRSQTGRPFETETLAKPGIGFAYYEVEVD